MIRSPMTLAVRLSLTVSAASAAPATDVVGLWKTPVQGGVIRIERCGEAICGRSVDSRNIRAHPDQTDVHNPDPTLRGRPVKGLLILKALPMATDHWGDGSIYNPNDGATYHATFELEGADRLKVTGCLVAPLCRSQVWTRSDGG